MKPITARTVYALGVFLLAACASIPEVKAPSPLVAEAKPAPASPEALLAKAVRTRIEVERSVAPSDHKRVEVKGAEACLRDYVGRSNPNHHRELINALSNQLADAMDDRTRTAQKFGPAHPETVKAEKIVLDLTAAINAEVHNNNG